MAARRVIAEIGSCDGDLALAVDTAQAALESGAWMVKGQMYQASTLVTRNAPTYGHDSIVEKATQWEAFSDALSYDDWRTVAATTNRRFFASVFDTEACRHYPYDYIKIASADITYQGLIEAAALTGKPLIVSTGAATRTEINRMLSWIPGVPVTLMVCTLSYPCAPKDAHVNRVVALRDNGVDVGYSDHTRGTAAAHLAFELGASMVEKHFTIRPGTGGDHDFAIGPDQLREIVEQKDAVSDAVAAVYGGGTDFGPRPSEMPARQYARRSLHARTDIAAGAALTRDLIDVLRPADGIEPWLVDDLMGVRTTRAILAGEAITTEMLNW